MKKIFDRLYLNRKVTLVILLSLSLSFITLALVNGFYKSKVESKIVAKLHSYSFDEYSKLNGFSVNFDEVDCNGFIYYDCKLSNFRLEVDIANVKKVLLLTDYATFKPKSVTNPFSFYLLANNIQLGKDFEQAIFFGYEEPYKTIADNLKAYIFPSDIEIDIDMKKRSKNKADGDFKIKFGNGISKVDLKSSLFIDNREYDEKIEIPNEEDKSLVAEINSTNVPFNAILDNISYYIEDVDFKGFLYELYRLNGENLKREGSYIVEGYNLFYLGVESSHILSKEEFLVAFKNMVGSFIKSVPDEEITLHQIMFSLEKLLNGSIKAVQLDAKNKGGVTLEKTGLLFMIDNINTTRRYLDDSFDIKIKEIK